MEKFLLRFSDKGHDYNNGVIVVADQQAADEMGTDVAEQGGVEFIGAYGIEEAVIYGWVSA